MKSGSFVSVLAVGLMIFSSLHAVTGIRFVIDREECFSHKVEYDGDTVHVSFVVVKSDSAWHYTEDGVDLVVISQTLSYYSNIVNSFSLFAFVSYE